MNKKAYDALAAEYDNPEHETVADFQRITENVFDSPEFVARLKPYFARKDNRKGGQTATCTKWLFVGVGTGAHVTKLTSLYDDMLRPEIHVLDISKRMLERAEQNLEEVMLKEGPISSLSVEEGEYEIVVGLLADPYFSAKNLEIIGSSIKPKGAILISSPTSEWAHFIRGDGDTEACTFHLSSGKAVTSRSYCPTPDEARSFAKEAGLELVHLTQVGASSLPEVRSKYIRRYQAEHGADAPVLDFMLLKRKA